MRLGEGRKVKEKVEEKFKFIFVKIFTFFLIKIFKMFKFLNLKGKKNVFQFFKVGHKIHVRCLLLYILILNHK